MIKQIKDLNAATIDDLNDDCQFVIDDSNDKTKKVSFNVLKQKIGSGGEGSESNMLDLGGGKEITSFDGTLECVTTQNEYEIYTATQNCKFFIHSLIDDIVTSSGVKRYLKLLVNGNAVALASDHGLGDNRQMELTWCCNLKTGDVVKLYYDCITNRTILYEYSVNELRQTTATHPTDCVSYVVETGRFSSVDGTTHSTASENDSWYRLYSDGWCEMGGNKTYLASTSNNTETVTFAKSFLDTSFTLTFGAGSSGTAQDDGHIVNEDRNYRTVNTFGIQVTDPNASTKDAWNCWRAEGFVSTTTPTT